MNPAYFQGKLDKIQERIKRKINDNNIRLNSTPIDVIAISVSRDDVTLKDHIDNEMRFTINSHNVIPLVFPALVDVPYTEYDGSKDDKYYNNKVLIRTEYGEGDGKEQKDLSQVDVYAPVRSPIKKGDFVVRCFIDDPYINVVMFEVKESLGTFSENALLSKKLHLAVSTINIPENSTILGYIKSIAKSRVAAKY